MVELLSPAGDFDKLKTALAFGADAAYMGLPAYSLRANARNIALDDKEALEQLKVKTGKKLYLATNILFHQDQIEHFEKSAGELASWPFDAFIVSDLGAMDILKEYCPDKEIHISTQASCLNARAAKTYYRLGAKRVILGREASIDDIKRIKDAVPELQIETFVHGAMCMAYSGRCLLSAFFAGRSGNQGDCAHSCRWHYRLAEKKPADLALEELERPGEYYPISEENGYTTILSSKDLCMIDHLQDLIDAGVDSLKIEGRMKSLYYVAVVTRAYRKALDHADDWKEYRKDLFNISHREYSTGFFYGNNNKLDDDINTPTIDGYERNYLFIGIIHDEVKPGIWSLDVRFQVKKGQRLEYIGKDVLHLIDDDYTLLDDQFNEVSQIDHCKVQYLKTDKPVKNGYIIRRLNEGDLRSTALLPEQNNT